MSKSQTYRSTIAAVILLAGLAVPTVAAGQEDRLAAALARPAAMAFDQTPWSDVLRALRASIAAPIFVDRQALRQAQVRPDTPVTFRLSGVSLRTALGLLLRQLRLDWSASGEVLVITAPERLWLWHGPVAYDVSDLLPSEGGGQASDDRDLLADLIVQDIAPDTWTPTDGKGAIETYEAPGTAALVVGQTWSIDRKISELLAQLRQARRGPPRQGSTGAVPFEPLTSSPGEQKILAALARPVSLALGDASLSEAAGALRQALGIDLRIAPEVSLEKVRDAAGPIELRLDGVPAETVLKLLAVECGLTWTVRDDVLWLLPPETEGNRLLVEVYDVRDLAGPRTDPAKTESRLDELAAVIEATVAEDTWADAGGGGSISSFASDEKALLTVTQSWHTHHEIESLLEKLREAQGWHALTGRGAQPSHALSGRATLSPDAPLRKALAAKVTLDLDSVGLEEAVAALQKQLAVTLFVDRRAIGAEEGVAQQRVSLHQSGITAQSALDLLLAPFELAWTVHDNLIVITTPTQAEGDFIVRVYDVGGVVPGKATGGAKPADELAALADKITDTVAPKNWGEGLSQAAITPFRAPGITALVIVQTWRNHEAIAALLQNETKR